MNLHDLPVVPTSAKSGVLQTFNHRLLKIRWGKKCMKHVVRWKKMSRNCILRSVIQFDDFTDHWRKLETRDAPDLWLVCFLLPIRHLPLDFYFILFFTLNCLIRKRASKNQLHFYLVGYLFWDKLYKCTKIGHDCSTWTYINIADTSPKGVWEQHRVFKGVLELSSDVCSIKSNKKSPMSSAGFQKIRIWRWENTFDLQCKKWVKYQ